MKFICTGDWHLGNMFHGIDRLDEHRHFLDWMVEHIEQLRPDALLIAGDVFDSGNPSAASQKAYYGFLARLSSLGHRMKVIVTAGNHDSYPSGSKPRALCSAACRWRSEAMSDTYGAPTPTGHHTAQWTTTT